MPQHVELMEATEMEANERREQLIAAGIISTRRTELTPEEMRTLLVCRGIIKPVEKLEDGTVTYCPLPERLNVRSTNPEEGEYRVKPIVSESDYERRKMVYFRSLQELLFARRHLNLIVGKKEEKDPEWFF